jgi:hypothetical protein
MMSSVLGDACKWGFFCEVWRPGRANGDRSWAHQRAVVAIGGRLASLWGACNTRYSDALSVAATSRRVCTTLCSDVCRASECRGLRGIAPPHRSLCRAVSWACEELDLDPASRAGGGAAEGARHCYSRDARLIRVQDISLLVCFSCMRIAELLFRISFILAECFFCGVIFG